MAKRRAKRKAGSKRSSRGRPRRKSTRRAAPTRRRQQARASRPARAKARKPTAKRRAVKRPKRNAARPSNAKAPAKAKAPANTKAPAKAKVAVPHAAVPPRLGRERRRLSDDERLDSAAFADERLLSSAKAGHDELRSKLSQHNETSPALAGGDIDAKWQDAYAVGDEAPGGDNPTPGQDRVDDIGKALGVNYRRDEELKGGDEIAERDKHRWELDPASSDDWPHSEKEQK